MPANPLSARERKEIRAGIEHRECDQVIGGLHGRHRTTINAEINRNGGRARYSATAAERRAVKQRCRPNTPKLLADVDLAAHVTARLQAKDSPMTISIELERGVHGVTTDVSHECIYQAIYAHGARGLDKGLHEHLHRRRRCRRHRRHGDGIPGKTSPLGTFVLVTERPDAALERSEIGHLEGDLVVGANNRSALVTAFDRMSRKLWLADLPDGYGADETLAAVAEIIDRIPDELRRTLTWDQGREMARHRELAEIFGIDVYFCDPHSPWQRPTNENGNGLLRRYVGKGTDLSIYGPDELRAIEHRINTMPRRVLHWSTAEEVYARGVAMTG